MCTMDVKQQHNNKNKNNRSVTQMLLRYTYATGLVRAATGLLSMSFNLSQGINESANFRFLQRLSVIFCFRRDCPRSSTSCRDYSPRKMASCRNCPCDFASCSDSRQEAKSHGQSLQEAIYRAQQSRQKARDRGQSRRKPNMTDSLCRKRKFADSFISCV